MSAVRWEGGKGIGVVALVAALGIGIAPACFDTTDRVDPEFGGETHFMRECAGSCEAGLSCVCGVCTRACEESASCESLAESATCAQVAAEAAACGEEAPARACAALCGGDEDCRQLGENFACVQGQCRPGAAKQLAPVFEGAAAACREGECKRALQPLVLLLVDTSGSTELKAGCQCHTPSCDDCQPDCARAERSRFTDVIEALGGSFEDFACEALPRDEANGATYDLGYFLPYHRPTGTQRDDGLIDAYGERLRFALATLDSWDTYQGEPPLVHALEFDADASADWRGQWSYSPERVLGMPALLGLEGTRVGALNYPGGAGSDPYYIDIGIRSAQAAEGGLLVADEPASERTIATLHARMKAMLPAIRPYGGTPIAAALDDLYYLMAMDPMMAAERALPARKHVVLITDGRPDPDYRDLHCQCASEGDAQDPFRCTPTELSRPSPEPAPPYDPARMSCPYPAPAAAARALHCGRSDACAGPVQQLSVVGYTIADEVVPTLDEIAQAGGSSNTRLASNPTELREQLDAILEEIATED